MKKTTLTVFSLFFITAIFCQEKGNKNDFQEITTTIMLYIDGTANGEPEKLEKAFHPDFNLYSVKENDSLRVWAGSDYVGRIKKGVKNTRQGRIISIDYEKDAAIAKAEIVIPGWRIFTDYFLLLKYEGSWKIVHKSYTWRPYPKSKE